MLLQRFSIRSKQKYDMVQKRAKLCQILSGNIDFDWNCKFRYEKRYYGEMSIENDPRNVIQHKTLSYNKLNEELIAVSHAAYVHENWEWWFLTDMLNSNMKIRFSTKLKIFDVKIAAIVISDIDFDWICKVSTQKPLIRRIVHRKWPKKFYPIQKRLVTANYGTKN